eukprot:Opistho-2@76404
MQVDEQLYDSVYGCALLTSGGAVAVTHLMRSRMSEGVEDLARTHRLHPEDEVLRLAALYGRLSVGGASTGTCRAALLSAETLAMGTDRRALRRALSGDPSVFVHPRTNDVTTDAPSQAESREAAQIASSAACAGVNVVSASAALDAPFVCAGMDEAPHTASCAGQDARWQGVDDVRCGTASRGRGDGEHGAQKTEAVTEACARLSVGTDGRDSPEQNVAQNVLVSRDHVLPRPPVRASRKRQHTAPSPVPLGPGDNENGHGVIASAAHSGDVFALGDIRAALPREEHVLLGMARRAGVRMAASGSAASAAVLVSSAPQQLRRTVIQSDLVRPPAEFFVRRWRAVFSDGRL